jgi:8-oxo-dGTP pyrophosphatase MutT (NUDIX family)
MNWKTHVTVAAIVHRDDRFLMVEEYASGKLVINQPAGHLEAGESLVDAVVRETLEETAWSFTPEALLGIYQWQQPGRNRTYLRFAFCGTVEDHNPSQELDEGIVRALWLTRSELENRAAKLRGPMVMQCVHDYQIGRRYPLDVLAYLEGHPEALSLMAGAV